MNEPNQADWEKAKALAIWAPSGSARLALTEGIAQALADERQKAFNEGAVQGMALVREERGDLR